MNQWLPVSRGNHVRHLLSDYIDGCLPPAVAHRVEIHVAHCCGCAWELEQWRSMLQLVSLHAQVPCPIDCAEAVLQRLQATERSRGRGEGATGRRGEPAKATTGHGFLPPSPRRPLAPSVLSAPSRSLAWAAIAVLMVLLGGWRWYESTRSPAAYSIAAPPVALVAPAPMPASAPDRLEGVFGRSDSLILASDFAEGER